jgi:serine/threonine protein kinase
MKIPVPGLLLTGPHGPDTVCLDRGLGAGAFGFVFLAKDTTDGVQYAVKFPQHAFFGGAPELSAFFNEVQAARDVRHANVVRVLHAELSAADIPPYLIMEYLPGGTLKARLDKTRNAGSTVPPGMVRQWAEGLIEGMEAINAKMLHRDLKPDNILLDGDTLKIADFGLSKLVGAATRSNTFKGGQHTLYMAPEGWKLDKNEIQIDMYALGIVLYEIAALRYPYNMPADPRDFARLQEMHFFQQAPPLSGLRPDLPTSFCHVVAKLMEKRAQDRFTSWQQARDSVRQAFASSPPSKAVSAPVINSLVHAVGELHDVHSRQRLQEKAREEEQRQWNQINEFQAKKLIEELRTAAAAFNEASPLAQIQFIERGQCTDFSLPYGGSLSVNFFKVDPPLTLKRGNVRFAALVRDQNGGGLNFLLCRSDDGDLYGRWVPIRVNISVLVDPRRYPPREQPFGFDQSEIKEIGRAEGAMHIFKLDYPEAPVGDVFLQAVRETMARGKKR